MSRQRGMTIIEIMIAMFLASLVSAAVLMITRTELIAYEQNDQVIRMQQNERAGVGFLENLLRRACGGIAYGQVGVNVGVQKNVDCLTVYDGATQSSGSFVNGTASSGLDAVEIIYGTTPFPAITAMTMTATTTPTVTVSSTAGFKVNDLVLVTQKFQLAGLFKISAIDTATNIISLGTLSAATNACSGAGCNLPAGFSTAFTAGNYWLMKAVSESLYVETSTSSNYLNMMMLDPDGITGTDHSDADPLVENVVDFQMAMGCDDNSDGTITENVSSKGTDEWYGNFSGELPLTVANWHDGAGKNPIWLRLSFIFQTGNKYSGGATPLPNFEDRTTYPAVGAGMPRYRPVRINLAPRSWNVLN